MAYPKANCPCCTTPTLEPVRFHEETAMECIQCRGLWFEDRALNQAINQFHDGLEGYCHIQELGDHLGTSQRICPHCWQPMQHYHLLQDYTVEVDRCPTCNGIWLDHHEVEQVMHSPSIKTALTRLNGDTGWKSWSFQFLTRMPIEYNLHTHRMPWVTYLLILLCALVFLAGTLDATAHQQLLVQLALSSDIQSLPLFFQQLITHQFVHGSWLHLASNLYFLWVVGDNLEDVLGHARFLLIYLLAGTLAALAELLWYQLTGSGTLLLIGASGSIAALFGLYLVWFRFASLTFMFIIWQKKLAPHWFFLIWSASNIFGMLMGNTGVAFMAHLGGLVFGILLGLLMKQRILQQNPLIRLLNQPEARIQR